MSILEPISQIIAGLLSVTATSVLGPVDPPQLNAADLKPASGYRLRVETPDGSHLRTLGATTEMHSDIEEYALVFLLAVLAAEDHRFQFHGGLDPIGIASAVKDTLSGTRRGGSTITQQMIKNRYLSPEQTMTRKIQEAVLAGRLHKTLGRKQILEMYLSSAYAGRGEIGMVNAPDVWFGKTWDEITIAEAAYLAGLLKGPSRYDGMKYPERAKTRRNAILARMHSLDWITDEDYESAIKEELNIIEPKQKSWDADYHWEATAALHQAESLGVLSGDMRAVSSIDPKWQDIAEKALARKLNAESPVKALDSLIIDDAALDNLPIQLQSLKAQLLPIGSKYMLSVVLETSGAEATVLDEQNETHSVAKKSLRGAKRGDVVALNIEDGSAKPVLMPVYQGAVVVLDSETGRLLASVGGSDEHLTGLDRTRAFRQPGSAIKPILWLAALDSGLDARDQIENTQKTWVDPDGTKWTPRNYDRSQSGPVTVFTSLEASLNIVAARLLDVTNLETFAMYGRDLGAYPNGMTMTRAASIGSSETTLVDLTRAYAAIMNVGISNPVRPWNSLWRMNESGEFAVDNGQTMIVSRGGGIASYNGAIDLHKMMRGVVTRGTAASAFSKAKVPIIGKTGTSQSYKDAWFVGATPHVTVGVWIGRDDNKPMNGRASGGKMAAPVVRDVFETAASAGLIDEDGLMRDTVASGIEWPVQPFSHQDLNYAPVVSNYSESQTYISNSGNFIHVRPAGQTVRPEGQGNSAVPAELMIPNRNGDLYQR